MPGKYLPPHLRKKQQAAAAAPPPPPPPAEADAKDSPPAAPKSTQHEPSEQKLASSPKRSSPKDSPKGGLPSKYVPPHMRGKKGKNSDLPPGADEPSNVIEHKWNHKAVAEGSEFYLPADKMIHEYLHENSSGYRDWKATKQAFGSNPNNDSYFTGKYRIKQNRSKKTDSRKSKGHMAKYYNVFVKMSDEHGIVDPDIRTFADVCCAPGGFAKAVLDLAPHCEGEGMSIDPDRLGVGKDEKAGHIMELENDERWYCHLQDVMEDPHKLFFFGGSHLCELMIVDGNFLYTISHKPPECQEEIDAIDWFNALEDREKVRAVQDSLRDGAIREKDAAVEKAQAVLDSCPLVTPEKKKWVVEYYNAKFKKITERICHVNMFLCSRILVGLQNLADKCTMVIQNGTRPSTSNIWLWGMLTDIFDEVKIVKATLGCHSINNSAYIIAKGYNLPKAKTTVIPLVFHIMNLLRNKESDWFDTILQSDEWGLYKDCSDLKTYLELKGQAIIEIIEKPWARQVKTLKDMDRGNGSVFSTYSRY